VFVNSTIPSRVWPPRCLLLCSTGDRNSCLCFLLSARFLYHFVGSLILWPSYYRLRDGSGYFLLLSPPFLPNNTVPVLLFLDNLRSSVLAYFPSINANFPSSSRLDHAASSTH
jgi:hypothetical protein